MMMINEEVELLNMRGAAEYLGRSYRWMQRNYVNLLKAGVGVYRLPHDSPKGRLMFSRPSLDAYIQSCKMSLNEGALEGL